MKTTFLILLTIILNSCETNSIKTEHAKADKVDTASRPSTPIDDKKKMDSLITRAIFNGDESAYNKVSSYYLIEDRVEEFLYTALTVANKYNNSEASYHVFTILNGLKTGEDINKLDIKTKNLALYYLIKSYEQGFESAKFRIKEIFGDKKIPKSSFFLQEFGR